MAGSNPAVSGNNEKKKRNVWPLTVAGLELHLRQVLVTSQMLCRYYWNLKTNREKCMKWFSVTFINFFYKKKQNKNILPHPHSLPMTVKKRISQTKHKLRNAIKENDEPLLISINLSHVRQGEVSDFPCTFPTCWPSLLFQ